MVQLNFVSIAKKFNRMLMLSVPPISNSATTRSFIKYLIGFLGQYTAKN